MNSTPNPRDAGFIEEGSAFLRLAGRPEKDAERQDVIVIGAGQTGLSVGYHLKRRGVRFLMLDANERVGDVWRHRWDSLRLFTPARFDGLVGMPFPATRHAFPTKDEMADYLEAYARHFDLPVRCGMRVERLWRDGERYVVEAGGRRFEAAQVIVAMASYQKPRIPAFARELEGGIVQLHSSAYRNPAQLKPGGVLIVGAGNSGAEIALEVARSGHPTWMAGRNVGEVPFRIAGLPARLLLVWLVLRVLFHRILTLDTPLGRRVRPRLLYKGGPLIRVHSRDLEAAGVRRAARVEGVREGRPMLADGTVLDVANVVWSTGYHPGFTWVDLPVLDEHGDPKQVRGVVESEPGLYFVGLHFLYALSSTMIHGADRDTAYVADRVARKAAEGQAAASERSATAAAHR
jgi:putative flavoprotein involved in K+ transport